MKPGSPTAPPKTFERVGLLTGLNQAFQCVGSILIAPLIKRWPTKLVLSCAILVFSVMTAILLIVDAGTGGCFRPDNWADNHDDDDFGYYGSYNANGIIPIYCVSGIAYGMVELIRRVVPRDIVGSNVQKLRRMDALVHIFYEISGTAGAFFTALVLIPSFGNNYSFLITPIFFAVASIYLPYWYPKRGDVNEAWRVAGTFVPISFGWAAGDVSLAAYIQASLARLEAENKEVSALGAVMAFLYSTYIVIYAICSPLLGRYIDRVYAETGGSDGGNIHRAIRNVGGVQFTVLMAVVLASTFIPKGALSFNPKILNDEVLDHDIDCDADDGFVDGKERRASIVDKKMKEQVEERRQSVTRVSADINNTFSPNMKNMREEDGGLMKS
ncbi:uncharacterized protein A1O5_07084 [Cladophialophora psammophila CBS 110553]|uniref:Uncharacterized protein n=1 Tax=Cladophialophora psammophila CBS 110553 TaxID=1182543 RepID=W9WZB1_9EURO|nr:uncharacterized protein A1O5_07084 [Cladophialophora psammophila CBS 110553]EXJ70011.1 hypothetical protein A1O5_07084 [Cladophialophora psammophila CBS 110553]